MICIFKFFFRKIVLICPSSRNNSLMSKVSVTVYMYRGSVLTSYCGSGNSLLEMMTHLSQTDSTKVRIQIQNPSSFCYIPFKWYSFVIEHIEKICLFHSFSILIMKILPLTNSFPSPSYFFLLQQRRLIIIKREREELVRKK